MFALLKKKDAQNDAVVEAIVAGTALTRYLTLPEPQYGANLTRCICNAVVSHIEEPEGHHNYCPIARWYRATAKLARELR